MVSEKMVAWGSQGCVIRDLAAYGEQRAAEKIEGGLRRGKCVQSRERGNHRHPPPHSDHIPGAELRRKQESGRVKYIEHHRGIPAELFVKGVLRRPQPPAKGKRR